MLRFLKEGRKSGSLGGGGKKSKEGKEGKEKPVATEDPLIILDAEIQQETSTSEVVNIGEQLETLIAAFKKLTGANKQLLAVGKHLVSQTSDTNIGKQLTVGYPYLSFCVCCNLFF
jgi:hypothetical protein